MFEKVFAVGNVRERTDATMKGRILIDEDHGEEGCQDEKLRCQ
jgi:hypothetical protein